MYTPLYNRLCGWTCFALGMAGLISGRIGDYAYLTTTESWIYVGIGVLGMAAARWKWRDSLLFAAFLTAVATVWAVLGWLNGPLDLLGPTEPSQNALHTVMAAWGVYVLSSDTRSWIRIVRANQE